MKELIQEDLNTIIEQVGVPLMDLEGSYVVITGACGFLGSWFVALIAELNKNHFKKPCDVLAIDSFIATDQNNHIANINDGHITLAKLDCSHQSSLMDTLINHKEKIGKPIDYIIHAAGIASPVYYRQFPIQTIDGMVLGLKWLMEYVVDRPVKSFLYFSSSEMYGNPHSDKVPTPETYNGNVSATGPRSCYDEAKRLGESYCVAYHRMHNIPVKWVRPFNVFGPGMREKDDRVAPKFMFQAIKKQPLTVHVPGVQTRTLCYITDAMTGFLKTLLIGKNGEVYNIGNSSPEITMLDLAELTKQTVGQDVEINQIEMPTEYPQDQAQRRCPDITKATEELGYTPKVSLIQGLAKLHNWCQYIVQRQKN